MTGACRLNNRYMKSIRREAAYQCMAIDLAMLGVISKEECEMLIGAGIPKNITLPNGRAGSLVSEETMKPAEGVVVDDTEAGAGTEEGTGTETTEPTETETTEPTETETTEPTEE